MIQMRYTEEEIKKTMGDRGRNVSGIGAQGRREERWSITLRRWVTKRHSPASE